MEFDTVFWRNAAERFRVIPDLPSSPLRAEFCEGGWAFGGEEWTLQGGSTVVISAFKVAGDLVALAQGGGGYLGWLDILRRDSGAFRKGPTMSRVDPNSIEITLSAVWRNTPEETGTEEPSNNRVDLNTGTIDRAVTASIELCERRATESMRIELETKPVASRHYPSVIARNIDLFRDECGWTIEELAVAVKLDRAAVWRTIRKGTVPRNLNAYSDAFAKRLNRPITPQDLKQ